ncbi:MAG: hypothetical protein V3U29_00355, partial [Phycisphaeraceae bacterium]
MRNTVRMAVAAIVLVPAGTAVALDIDGVLTAALDQPRINVVVRRSATGAPLTATDIFGFEVFNVQAFYDSGAGGILLSNATADALGIVRETFAGSDVIFEDVGVGGADQFNVSEQLYFSLAN